MLGIQPPPHLACLTHYMFYCIPTMLLSWCTRRRGGPILLHISGPAGFSRVLPGLYRPSLRSFTPPTPQQESMGPSHPPPQAGVIVHFASSEFLGGGGTMFYMSVPSLGVYLLALGGGLLYLCYSLGTRPLPCMHVFRYLLMLCPVWRRGSMSVSEIGI